jgi:hypothetical protein
MKAVINKNDLMMIVTKEPARSQELEARERHLKDDSKPLCRRGATHHYECSLEDIMVNE